MREDGTRATVTSVDVARRAGVSQSAVSLVFGGKAAGRVSARTREAILCAARELGYQPNRAARTLRSRQSRLVALAVPDVTNPYFAAALQGAEQEARQHGYAVMLASVRDASDWRQVIPDLLSTQAVDGLLLFASPPTDLHAALHGKAVVVDASSRVLPSLQLAIVAGTRAAMGHLLALGHRKIAHLAAAVEVETFELRRRGYHDALPAAGIPAARAREERAAFDIADARRAALALLRSPDPPTAILCDSDMLAVGIYKAARELDLDIPRDLSVASFDDSIIASMLEPELTTVAIPTAAIGAQAFRLLLAVLRGEPAAAETLVPLELVIRASTAAPGRRERDVAEGTSAVDAGGTVWPL